MTRKGYSRNNCRASALILTVVLTSMLAIVGAMFVMSSRIDKISTSAISARKDLNSAVDTIVAKISRELVLDVPGVMKSLDPNRANEYYDYPGEKDKWLACLEPYEDGSIYKWGQISDVTGYLENKNYPTRDIEVKPVGLSNTKYVDDYSKIRVDDEGDFLKENSNSKAFDGVSADADGDGIADSKWIELDDLTSSKGEPIYAAIRVIDNGGMLNVNTAYEFDADNADGSQLTQINLMGLAKRSVSNTLSALEDVRCGSASKNLDDYIEDVVWRYYMPAGNYTPFDISDELELRNRFLLENENIDVRIEDSDRLWASAFTGNEYLHVPVGSATSTLSDWFKKAHLRFDADSSDPNYSYRHLATIYNMDRIIDPAGWRKMFNINKPAAEPNELYDRLIKGVDFDDPNFSGDESKIRKRFAQFAVNLIDFIDADDEVTVMDSTDTADPNDSWGRVCGFDAQPFITEIAKEISVTPGMGQDYFAAELYNPFDADISLSDYRLELINPEDSTDTEEIALTGTIKAGGYYVVSNNCNEFDIDPNADCGDYPRFKFYSGWQVYKGAPPKGGGAPGGGKAKPSVVGGWGKRYDLYLKRGVETGEWIYVDRQLIEDDWEPVHGSAHRGRYAQGCHVVYQQDQSFDGDLGQENNDIDLNNFENRFGFLLPNATADANSLRLRKFVTVGDISRILAIGHGTDAGGTIGQQLELDENRVKLDYQNPYNKNIFQYLTVFDPTNDTVDNDGDGTINENNIDETPEFKIPGRININTAPWYVIAQLPWMTEKKAQAVVAYRDKLAEPVDYNDVGMYGIREYEGFESIGELNFVTSGSSNYRIDEYGRDGNDISDLPDLTGSDGFIDDFEERDVIFSRISNLVTVRSDVFTAYILVRIGVDGPQKRVIAILDRSNVYPYGGGAAGRVKIVALHPVADPR
jgi:hypothetical protein